MEILLKSVRIKGFRGLQNVEVNLEMTTVLTGMNNSGKTAFLKALQIVFGNRSFLSEDDFNISNGKQENRIVIDTLILPIDKEGKIIDEFTDEWQAVFKDDGIQLDTNGNQIFPLRTVVSYDPIRNSYKTRQYPLNDWGLFKEDEKFWYDQDTKKEITIKMEELPFYYMNAQRDIIEDIKLKSSYFGKMISKIEYKVEDIKEIEEQIKFLNDATIEKSDILKTLKSTLSELNSAMNNKNEGVDLTPFTKKIRDLNKGMSIYYSDIDESFSMEYHGMGTRSWSSLLTLKAMIQLMAETASKEEDVYFPLVAIEEPEAHLHPNAQKQLYSQISTIKGQKIISTHSPYIAACAELSELRNFYKTSSVTTVGEFNIEKFNDEEIRKIKRMVMNTRGEVLFSKLLVFFEGETEEQALPIFAQDYFKQNPLELGIDFIGVSGYGNYPPFIKLADNLNIPWIIFSDGENDVIERVSSALKKIYGDSFDIRTHQNIILLSEECSFERYLIKENYIDEIKESFKLLYNETYLDTFVKKRQKKPKGRKPTSETCSKCKQTIYIDKTYEYSYEEAIYDCMIIKNQKTKLGPVLAGIIVESDKPLPSKVIELFKRIKVILSI